MPPDPVHPPETDLAALAEGTLLPEERTLLEAHLARCDACRGLAADLLDAGLGAEAAPAVRRRPRRVLLLAGIAAAIAVVLLVPSKEPPSDAQRLETAARTLARAHPDTLGDLSVLSEDEIASDPRPALRGGMLLREPSGRLLAGRPEFAWDVRKPHVARELIVRRDDGKEAWRRPAAEFRTEYPSDEPALAPGTYLWTVVARAEGGPDVEVDGSFTVVSPADAAILRAAWATIDREAPADLGALLKFHHALRHGYVHEARRWANEAASRVPSDLALRTRAAMQRRTGLWP